MRIANEGSQRLLEISKELVDKLGKVTVEDKSVDLSKLSQKFVSTDLNT